jgi:hypothetical protein
LRLVLAGHARVAAAGLAVSPLSTGGVMNAAVTLKHRPGVFIASEATWQDGVLTATGQWLRKTGANFATSVFGDVATYSWPSHEIRQVRWTPEEDAA